MSGDGTEQERLAALDQVLERANCLLDRLERQVEIFPELAAAVLSRFSQSLIERNLHQMLDDEQERRKRQSRFSGGGFKIGREQKS